MPTPRLFHIFAAITFGIGLGLEILGQGQFRSDFLFGGLTFMAIGHAR